MQIKNAAVFTLEQGFVEKDIYIENGYFVEADQYSEKDGQIIDGSGCYLIPGLVDVHFHGCAGEDFSDATAEGIAKIGHYELQNGITSICPASMTLSEEMLQEICENAVAYARNQEEYLKEVQSGVHGEEGLVSRLCGIHLEGPFISMEKKGAQNPDYIQCPNVEMFRRLQESAGGLVKLITIAPEVDGAEEFVRELANEVHISVGHTASDYASAYKAFEMGADHVTHFFNAMPGFTHRAPGVFGAAYDKKHVMAELICDGIHVDASAVRVMFGLFGVERMVLISDTVRATGMEDGEYVLGGLPITVKGKLATLHDGTIAGSATNLMDCVRTVVGMGIPLETAIRCATYNPAKSIGVDDVCGSIVAGKYGDCVLLRKEDLSTQAVILGGYSV